jgi:hypothetical protein
MKMSRIIKINVGTGWANGDYNEEVELPDTWDTMTEDKQDEYLNECATDLLFNTCKCSVWIEDNKGWRALTKKR